eukprot:scaffold8310_cov78-Skeletonema_dohrnii-CCMP3373.AAC.1
MRSRILSDSRNKTQADTNRVAHNDNQHGLYHTEKTYNMVMKARGNSSRGRCSAAGKESGRSSSGQRHSLDWSKHFHRQDTQLYRKDERPTMRGGNQVGEVRRALANRILNTTYKTAMEQNLIPDREALMTRIGNMIKFPNNTWSEKKPEWELPKTYFDT